MMTDREKYLSNMRDYYNTVHGRALRMFYGARRRAEKKALEFTITVEQIENALRQGKCERTGIAFVMDVGHSVFAPSIDRIKNELGYTTSNVQFVCCAYNTGKKHMTDEAFTEFILQAADFIRARQ
jgi:hypothetical protein